MPWKHPEGSNFKRRPAIRLRQLAKRDPDRLRKIARFARSLFIKEARDIWSEIEWPQLKGQESFSKLNNAFESLETAVSNESHTIPSIETLKEEAFFRHGEAVDANIRAFDASIEKIIPRVMKELSGIYLWRSGEPVEINETIARVVAMELLRNKLKGEPVALHDLEFFVSSGILREKMLKDRIFAFEFAEDAKRALKEYLKEENILGPVKISNHLINETVFSFKLKGALPSTNRIIYASDKHNL